MGPPPTIGSMLDDITPEGRIASRTVGALLVATGAGIVAASVDELTQRCGDEIVGACVSRSASGVLVTGVAVALAAIGIGILWRARLRPVDAYGSSRYVWALGAMFAVASIVIASRIPAFTCETGRYDDLLELCMHPPSTSEPHRWLLVKQAIVVIGLGAGAAIASRARWIRVTAPVTAVVWTGSFSWLILETLVQRSG